MTFKPLHRDIIVIAPDDWEDAENYLNDEFYKHERPLKFDVFENLVSPYLKANKSVYLNQFDGDEENYDDDDFDDELCTHIQIADFSPIGVIDTDGQMHNYQTMHSMVFPDANSIYFDWQEYR